MRIHRQRSDGTLLVSLGGGVGVVMRDRRVSKSYDLDSLMTMGPWLPADNSEKVRAAAVKQLAAAHWAPLAMFALESRYPERAGEATRRAIDEGRYGGDLKKAGNKWGKVAHQKAGAARESAGRWADPAQVPEPKDFARVTRIAAKAGGDKAKGAQIASTMAKSITDPDKAIRRARAAEEEGLPEIAKVFKDRHAELTGKKPGLAEAKAKLKDVDRRIAALDRVDVKAVAAQRIRDRKKDDLLWPGLKPRRSSAPQKIWSAPNGGR